MLLSAGADVNLSTNDGYSPIFAASREDRHDVVIELLAAGAEGTLSSNFFPNCSDEVRIKLMSVLVENGGALGTMNKLLKSFKDNRAKKNFFATTKFSLQSLSLNNYRFWLYFIQQLSIEGLEEIVEDYVDSYPELLYVLEPNGQFAVHRALPPYKSILQSRMALWHDRYMITEKRPLYISATCVVYKALDYSVRDKQGKAIVIALKLMKYKSQYVKEIGIRKQLDMGGNKSVTFNNNTKHSNTTSSNSYVVAVLSSHAPRINKESTDDSMDLHDFVNYGQCDRVGTSNEDNQEMELALPPPSMGSKYKAANGKQSANLAATTTIIDQKTQDITARNAAKFRAEKLFCIAMPLAVTNLHMAMKQERFIAKNLQEIKSIFLQILHCVDFFHSKGIVHGP